MAIFGVVDGGADDWIGVEPDPAHFEVYRENWPTLQVFLSMSSQWRWTGGMESHRAGLDYSTWKNQCKKAGVRRRDRITVFAGVQVMEHAALDVWNKQQSKKQSKKP